MVRQLNRRILLDWRAVLIIFIGSGAIVWHILACRESPMSFSPQGDRLAFVTMEPFGTSDLLLRGTHAYRLMVATKAREVRVVETSTTDMLCAPAFSPDGASLAYLQIPLPTPERLQTLRELESERSAQTQPSAPTWLDQSAVQGTPAPDEALDVVDETLPPISGAMWFLHLQKSLPPVPARLIIRDARTDAVQHPRSVLDEPRRLIGTVELSARPPTIQSRRCVHLPGSRRRGDGRRRAVAQVARVGRVKGLA